MSSPIILMAYLGILFVGLFFILKNVVRLYKEVDKAEKLLDAANQEAVEAKRQIDQFKADAERLKVELEQKSAEAARRASEVQQAAGEAKRATIELQVKANELTVKEQEAQLLSVELEGLRNKLKVESVKSAQYKDHDERLLKLKSDVGQKDQELQSLRAELAEANKFKDALVKKDSELAVREVETKKLREALEAKASALAAGELEIKRLTLEMGKLESRPADTSASDTLIAEKDNEIQRLNNEFQRMKTEYPAYDERIARIKAAEGEITRLEKSLEDEKHSLRNVRMRAQESKMKLDLLGEKTKEAVESIAQFAESKEFEEFRKSIHMDETIRKYEDEIKHLKIQLIELEKKG